MMRKGCVKVLSGGYFGREMRKFYLLISEKLFKKCLFSFFCI